MAVQSNKVLEYILTASTTRKNTDGKSTPQMVLSATTFELSMKTGMLEWDEISEHITKIQEICEQEKYTKEQIQFLISFLKLKCDFSASRIIQTKVGNPIEILSAMFMAVFANIDLATTVNNYKYWDLVLQQVLKAM
jgi:hypothetical protein